MLSPSLSYVKLGRKARLPHACITPMHLQRWFTSRCLARAHVPKASRGCQGSSRSACNSDGRPVNAFTERIARKVKRRVALHVGYLGSDFQGMATS